MAFIFMVGFGREDIWFLNDVLFFWLDPKETKGQGWESSAVNLS